MSANPNRVQAGVPTGGQFAAGTHPESSVDLLSGSIPDGFLPEGSPKLVSGRLTQDPEIRYTRDGEARTRVVVGGDDGETRTVVTVYAEMAENCALSLVKGDRVVVQGKIRYDQERVDDDSFTTRVGVDAEDIGASMRAATVDIHRIQRHGVDLDNGPEVDDEYGEPDDDGVVDAPFGRPVGTYTTEPD
jgi:single-strand DNA-binding protein